jgi:hypothetical protein
MDKIKKLILVAVPTSICNFRCHYCYLAQRPVHYEGLQADMKYTPEQVAYALRQERVGGPAFLNLCADGETLLTNDIDKYVHALLKEGHYIEFVTNLTVTPMLDRMLDCQQEMRKRLEFKCSFHYIELKKKGLLERFAENVKKVWAAGASANIEITPSDELIPYIDEVKEFSMKHFGALPHLTIARDDRTDEIGYLTKLSKEEYDKVWSQFGSGFWEFKQSLFGVKQKDFCYAGEWGFFVNLATGVARPCYYGNPLGDVFANPDEPLPHKALGKCPIAHCYNGHALMSLGFIPHKYSTRYGDIRNRVRPDGSQWLQPELLSFFNGKLEESNREFSPMQKFIFRTKEHFRRKN